MRNFTLVCFLSFCLVSVHAQTVVSKSCGSCHKPVSANARMGQRCPHCGVRWGYENTTHTKQPSYSSPSYSDLSEPQSTPTTYTSLPDHTSSFPNVPESTVRMHSVPEYVPQQYDSGFTFEQSNVIKNCNLRSAPSTEAEILGTLSKNASIFITKFSGSWVKIQYTGSDLRTYVGWLHKSNVVL